MKQDLLSHVSHRVLTGAALLLVALFANAQTNVCKNTTTGTEYTDIQAAVNAVVEGQTIQILQDVDLTKTINVEKTTPAFTLDLNGHVLNAGNIAAPVNVDDKANIIYNEGTLTIIDNAPSTEHTTWNADHKVSTDSVNLTDIKGGVLTGGKGYKYHSKYYGDPDCGGAIGNEGGTMTISGVTICGNKADWGGGIDNYGTLTISNCTVSGNMATSEGGALSNYGTLIINDGTTVKNNTSNASFPAGGIYSWNVSEEHSSLSISGKVTITDNTTNGAKANLCLSGDLPAPVAISNLKEGTNIGITTVFDDEIEGAYKFTTNGTKEDLNYFSADNADLITDYHDGYLRLVLPLDEETVTKEKLTKWKNAGGNVQIGRTFYKEGTPNSLCLPFSLSADSLAASPLAGYCKLEEFASAKVVTEDGTDKLVVTMVPATEIVAGKPYLITWPNENDNIVNPVFKHVTMTADEPLESEASNGVKYCGTLTSVALTENNICLYGDTKIEWSYTGDSIEAFHGYFTADFQTNPSIKYGMPIVVVDGESAGINNVDSDVNANANKNGKFIENGNIVIRTNSRKYTLSGQLLK